MSNYCTCKRYNGELLDLKPGGLKMCRRCGGIADYTIVEPDEPLAKFCSKTSRIYLASPYTAEDPLLRETRYQLSVYASAVLANAGYIVYSPIAYTHVMATKYNIQPTNSDWWLTFDESFVKDWATVIAVLMIPGYKQSSGVNLELEWAREEGLLEIHLTMEKLYDIARAGSTRLA